MKTRVFFWKEKKVLFSGGLLLWIVIGFSFRYRSSRVMAAAGLLSYLGNKKKMSATIDSGKSTTTSSVRGGGKSRPIHKLEIPPSPSQKKNNSWRRKEALWGRRLGDWLYVTGQYSFFFNIFRLLIYLDRRRPIPLSSRRSASSHIMISNQSSPFSFHPRTKLDFLKKGLYRN